MKTPLLPIQILSIYKSSKGRPVYLPSRMSLCTPDMYTAILGIKEEVESLGGQLFLSDLFRSYDMQFQANLDYVSGKKSAYSPPPGSSMHEAGRAFDMDLSEIKISLKTFWDIANRFGVTPIIDSPDSRLKEAWHFDCRGSHGLVYDYYVCGKGKNMKPYQAMAASSILSAGLQHDLFKGREKVAYIQSILVRLGHEIGNIDGLIGPKTRKALHESGIPDNNLQTAMEALEDLVQLAFPDEFSIRQANMIADVKPEHVSG